MEDGNRFGGVTVIEDDRRDDGANGGPGHDVALPTCGSKDAILDLDELGALYRQRSAARHPLRQRDLGLVERTVRREVARHLLAHDLPRLVAELVDAAADDLTVAPEPADSLESLMSDELRVVEASEHLKAVIDAVGLEALARLQSAMETSECERFVELGRERPPGWIGADELTVLEVTTSTGLGQQEVHARLSLATARSAAAADLRGRLRAGTTTLHRACTIHAETRSLPDDLGLDVTASVLCAKDDAPPCPSLFRQRLTRQCIAAGREAGKSRRAARQRRGARARLDGDGLGVLTIINDADKIVAAMERAEAVARGARQGGDPRDLDTLRADAMTDALLLGLGSHDGSDPTDESSSHDNGTTRPGRRPAAAVTIIVPLTTALGLTDSPCEVPGYGWVGAEHAREIMLADNASWRRLLVDARTGAALALETTAYRPTAAMRAQVEAVDGTCRGPGCTVPAARCDLDHDLPWPHGPTTPANLTSKHRVHHNLHTHGLWQVERDEGGAVSWRTAAGRRYSTRPRDWLDEVRTTTSRLTSGSRTEVADPPPPF